MTIGTLQHRNPPGALSLPALRTRCTGLGLPTWWFDAAGELIDAPNDPGLAGAWLRSRPVHEAVLSAARSRAERPWGTMELFQGINLVALEERSGRRTYGTIIAAALGPELFLAPEFAAACEAAGIDPGKAGRAMEPLTCFPARGLDRISTMLSWMRDDLLQAAKDRHALAEHGAQLTEMYEEIGLLYRLGRTMNRLTTPEVFVRSTCDELAATMPFGWIAVKFSTSARINLQLAGNLITAGTIPCDRGAFNRAALAVLPALQPARWMLLPQGPGADLAACVGSQVLAHPISRDGTVIGVLLAGNKRGPDHDISSFDTQLLDAAADYLGVFLDNAGLYADQHTMFLGTVQALTAAIDAKDRYTCGHSERVAYLGEQLALAAGLDEAKAERVRICGLLHDVGKIGVPEVVLCKPGRLNDDEFEQIKRHPTIGHRILRDIPALEDLLPGVLHHHERWDGRGYPDQLTGKQIPLIARLLAVADSFDAMSSNRSYRAAMPREKVLDEIARCAGTQFDPDLAQLFASLDLAPYDAMVERHRGVELRAA